MRSSSILALLCSALIGTAAAAQKLDLKIGATLPMSGRLAYVGEDIRRGLELGAADFGGKRLGFGIIVEDNQHDAKLAASTAHKLLYQDRVDVIVSLWDMADVVAPLAERAKTPHLAIRWNPHIAEKYSYTLTMESTYLSYVDSQRRLLKAMGARRIGLLTEEAQGWVLADEYLKKSAPAAGFEIAGDERYISESPDLRSVVLRLLQKKPDMVVLLSNPPNTEILIQRIREAAPAQKFTGYFEYMAAPALVEGIPFVAQFTAAPWFEAKFSARYGSDFKARAPQAYDIVRLIAEIQGPAPEKLSGGEFMRGVSRIHNLPGASGSLSVSRTRNIESECVWKIARAGRFEALDPASL